MTDRADPIRSIPFTFILCSIPRDLELSEHLSAMQAHVRTMEHRPSGDMTRACACTIKGPVHFSPFQSRTVLDSHLGLQALV